MKRAVCASLFVTAALAFCPLFSRAASPENVREFFEVTGAREQMGRMMSARIAPLTVQMKQLFPDLTQDEQEIIPQIFVDFQSQAIEAMLPAMDKIYEDGLTDGEVIAAIKFYRSSEGRSFLKKQQAGMEQTAAGQDATVHLTNAEATAAANYFQSSAGASLANKLPMLQQRSNQANQALMEQFTPELQQRLHDELKKRHPELK